MQIASVSILLAVFGAAAVTTALPVEGTQASAARHGPSAHGGEGALMVRSASLPLMEGLLLPMAMSWFVAATASLSIDGDIAGAHGNIVVRSGDRIASVEDDVAGAGSY
ncbi:hypothetical protein QBC34DRAFT_386506 [Podospora aff. communis PSN243]|uniref:Uncharacterized protein n=1 Tax=Podospora aff. communis PSN243 TaxID=3040156 RepID=A0AAV9G568_9PEZI|nr:hypothetical protein QBC34DRAFT_386506 [Podospora aff. communis PSN243]